MSAFLTPRQLDQTVAPIHGARARILEDSRRGMRWQVAKAFGPHSEAASYHAGSLAGRLVDSSVWVPWQNTGSGPTAPTAFNGPQQALEKRLGDTDEVARWRAVRAVSSMGVTSNDHADVISGRLEDKDKFVRWAAAEAFGRVHGRITTPHVIALACRLQDRNVSVQRVAADVLRQNSGQREKVRTAR